MLRNYYYLNRAVAELNEYLHNSRVTEIFSQDKDLLLFSIPTDSHQYRHLVISTNPSLPYLIVKDDHRKAKKNVININTIELPETINEIAIAENDRIISIALNNISIYFSVMGGRTNIYFIKDETVIDQYKKGKTEENLIERITQHNFITKSVYHKIEKGIFLEFDPKLIRSKYSFISGDIVNELSNRNNKIENIEKDFHQILDEIYNSDINVFYSLDDYKVRFKPDTFILSETDQDGETFSNFNSALGRFISKYFSGESFISLRKELARFISREIEKIDKRFNKLYGRIEMGDRSAGFYKFANLLSINRSLLVKGMKEIKVHDSESYNEIIIKLNPKHSPQESINSYFDKAKDEKINFVKSLSLFKEAETRQKQLQKVKDRFENIETLDELRLIKSELKISNKTNEKRKVESSIKLKEYLIDNKFAVLIGRDSKSNDLLSIKVAKHNDYWFHARGLPGSHVVLRVDNPKEGVPKYILKIAAQLAAFHSKAKTAKLAPVSYTFGKYVRKKKGMEPGKVLLTKEKVLLVRPEIPSSAVLVTEE